FPSHPQISRHPDSSADDSSRLQPRSPKTDPASHLHQNPESMPPCLAQSLPMRHSRQLSVPYTSQEFASVPSAAHFARTPPAKTFPDPRIPLQTQLPSCLPASAEISADALAPNDHRLFSETPAPIRIPPTRDTEKSQPLSETPQSPRRI